MLAGDFIKGDGTGGESIYGKTFSHENFILSHEKYAVSMSPDKDGRFGSAFLIQTGDYDMALGGKYVVFGKVSSGFETLEKIESNTNGVGIPYGTVYFSQCEVL